MKDKELNDITRLYDRFIRQCPGTEEYTQRLAEETQIILKLRFVDYFIQICDIIAMTGFPLEVHPWFPTSLGEDA